MADTYRGVRWYLEVEPPGSALTNALYWPEWRFWTTGDDEQFDRSLSITLPEMAQVMRDDELVELEFDLLEAHAEIKHDQQELEARMWSVLRKNDLEDTYRSLFQVTTPLWFGLWIHSPLNSQRCHVLARLLREIWQEEMDDKDKRAFLNGLEAALRDKVPLHVAAIPPGHVDLGWKTIFDHCPSCKANPPLVDHSLVNHSIMVTCPVCRHVYRPNETGSMMEWHFPTLGSPAGTSL